MWLRVAVDKGPFEKGSTANWSKRIHTIMRRRGTRYFLENDRRPYTYYELQKVREQPHFLLPKGERHAPEVRQERRTQERTAARAQYELGTHIPPGPKDLIAVAGRRMPVFNRRYL